MLALPAGRSKAALIAIFAPALQFGRPFDAPHPTHLLRYLKGFSQQGAAIRPRRLGVQQAE